MTLQSFFYMAPGAWSAWQNLGVPASLFVMALVIVLCLCFETFWSLIACFNAAPTQDDRVAVTIDQFENYLEFDTIWFKRQKDHKSKS